MLFISEQGVVCQKTNPTGDRKSEKKPKAFLLPLKLHLCVFLTDVQECSFSTLVVILFSVVLCVKDADVRKKEKRTHFLVVLSPLRFLVIFLSFFSACPSLILEHVLPSFPFVSTCLSCIISLSLTLFISSHVVDVSPLRSIFCPFCGFGLVSSSFVFSLLRCPSSTSSYVPLELSRILELLKSWNVRTICVCLPKRANTKRIERESVGSVFETECPFPLTITCV